MRGGQDISDFFFSLGTSLWLSPPLPLLPLSLALQGFLEGWVLGLLPFVFVSCLSCVPALARSAGFVIWDSDWLLCRLVVWFWFWFWLGSRRCSGGWAIYGLHAVNEWIIVYTNSTSRLNRTQIPYEPFSPYTHVAKSV
jgi:hypothetical protein